ncbi:MAG: hypothetical protein GC137_05850 [Alphaproteobacteria bacterium]|nr:hypothetical protein [Alphaproteobacteria bacterium]
MVMQSMRKGAEKGLFKYVFLGLLGMAVGGLAIIGIGDSFSGGSGSSNDVIKVAGKSVGIRQFDYALRRVTSRYNMSPQQAFALGLTQEVLGTEIRSTQIHVMAERMGIKVPKEVMVDNTAEIIAPYIQEGQTLNETLQQLLRTQGVTERDFLYALEREIAGGIVVDALRDGVAPNIDALAEELYVFQTQSRDIEILVFEDSEIKDFAEPTDIQLQNLYNALKGQKYSIPEYRSAEIAFIKPEDIRFDVSVTEEEMREAYDDNTENFVVGERYVMTQLVIEDKETADKVYAAVQEGKTLEQARGQIMGVGGRYLDKVPFEVGNMLPAIADVVSEFEIGKTSEPIDTQLGFHIVRLEAILPEETQAFEAVRSKIEKDLIELKKADLLYEITLQIDKSLQEGATAKDIAEKVDIDFKLSSIPLIDKSGNDKNGKSSLEDFEALDQEAIAQTIFEIDGLENASYFQELPSGTMMAFTLTKIEEESFKPYEEVKGDIQKQFILDQQRAANRELVRKLSAEIETGGTSFDGVQKEYNKKPIKISGITINGSLQPPLNETARATIFRVAPEGVDYLLLEGKSGLMKVTGYSLPEIDESALSAIETIQAQIQEEAKQEAMILFFQSLNEQYPARINQALLDRVYGQQNAQ